MKAEVELIIRQAPGWAPLEAVDSLHALIDGGERLVEWMRTKSDARWGGWLAGQGLAPYAWDRLKTCGAVGRLPADLSQVLKGSYYTAVADAQLHAVELRHVLGHLHEAGIDPILFKGAALAYTAYPDPACRPMADLDLWVTEEAMPYARSALSEAGYAEHTKIERPVELLRYTSGEVQLVGTSAGQGLVELHWGTFAGEWLRRTATVDDAGIMRRIRPIRAAGCDSWTLSPEDSILQVAVHSAVNHQMAYPGLRGLLDVALLARTENVHWATLAGRAKTWHIGTATWLVLHLTSALFGLDGAQAAIQALAPSRQRQAALSRFVDAQHVLEGRDMTGGPRRLAFQLLLVDRPRDAANLVWRTLWPERSWIRARYGAEGPAVRWRHLTHAVRGQI
jgi:hypothetical protein